MAYATPTEFWRKALPPDTLLGEQGIRPGPWTDPALTGVGLGTLALWERSNPHDAYQLRAQVARAGELHEPGYVNPGLPPQIRVSLDGGATWSRRLDPDAAGRIEVLDGGLVLQLSNGTQGAPVTIGAGNAALVFTPLRAGGSVRVLVGPVLAHAFRDGALVLTVANTTTATDAAAYLQQQAGPAAYASCAAGGDGSGVVQAAALTPLPFVSFAAGDVWAVTTTPSPDVVDALATASDLVDGYLRGTLTLPLTSWGQDLRRVVCCLARWELLVRRGLDQHQDVQIYHPDRLGVTGWLRAVQTGNLKITADETPPGVSFPLLVTPIDPLSREAGSFPI